MPLEIEGGGGQEVVHNKSVCYAPSWIKEQHKLSKMTTHLCRVGGRVHDGGADAKSDLNP